MPLPADELERLRAVVAPVQANLLKLLDARPKQPGIVPGSELPFLYRSLFGEPLEPLQLTGQADLKAMLNRRNIFPAIGVRGSDKKGGWLIYRVATSSDAGVASASAKLAQVQDNILELLRRAAHPTETTDVPHYSIDAGKLTDLYGAAFKQRFNYRDFGFATLRALLEACPKLGVVMKGKDAGKPAKPSKETREAAEKSRGKRVGAEGGAEGSAEGGAEGGKEGGKEGGMRGKDKMHVVARGPDGSMHKATLLGRGTNPSLELNASQKRPREVPEVPGGVQISGSDEMADKAARKAAKRARKDAEAGLSPEAAEAARAEAKKRRQEKKAAGKAKKAAWLAEHAGKQLES